MSKRVADWLGSILVGGILAAVALVAITAIVDNARFTRKCVYAGGYVKHVEGARRCLAVTVQEITLEP